MSYDAIRQADERLANFSDEQARQFVRLSDPRFEQLADSQIDQVVLAGYSPFNKPVPPSRSMGQALGDGVLSLGQAQIGVAGHAANRLGLTGAGEWLSGKAEEVEQFKSGRAPGMVGSHVNDAVGGVIRSLGTAGEYIGHSNADFRDRTRVHLTERPKPHEREFPTAEALKSYGDDVRSNVSQDYEESINRKFFNEDNTLARGKDSAWRDPVAYTSLIASGIADFAIPVLASVVTRSPVFFAAYEAVQMGGEARDEVAEAVLNLDFDVLDTSPLYQELLSEGLAPEDARATLAHTLGMTAGHQSAGVGTALGLAAGQLVMRALDGQMAGGLAARFGKQVVGQAGIEGVQESSLGLIANRQVGKVDESVGLTDGVANRAVQGTIGGAGGGALVGGMAGSISGAMPDKGDDRDSKQVQVDTTAIDSLAKGQYVRQPDGTLKLSNDVDLVQRQSPIDSLGLPMNEDGTIDLTQIKRPAPKTRPTGIRGAMQKGLDIENAYTQRQSSTDELARLERQLEYDLAESQRQKQIQAEQEAIFAEQQRIAREQEVERALALSNQDEIANTPFAGLRGQMAQKQIMDDANRMADTRGLPYLPGKIADQRPKEPVMQPVDERDLFPKTPGDRYNDQRSQDAEYGLTPNREYPATLAARAAEKMPPNYSDTRLADPVYRGIINSMSRELVRGGGVSMVRRSDAYDADPDKLGDGDFVRSSSLNPDWYRAGKGKNGDMGFAYVNSNGNLTHPSVAELQTAIDKALEGKPLKDSEKRMVTEMLNLAQEEVMANIDDYVAPDTYNPMQEQDQALANQQARDIEAQQEMGFFSEPVFNGRGEDVTSAITDAQIDAALEKLDLGKPMSVTENNIVKALDNQAWLSRNPKNIKRKRPNMMRDQLNAMEVPNAKTQPTQVQKTETEAKPAEKPEDTIKRLGDLIEQRKSEDYSEMTANDSDLMLLTDSERAELQEAKQSLPSQGEEAKAAKERISARREARSQSKPDQEGQTPQTQALADATLTNEDTNSETNQEITDFGEKLGGARKDQSLSERVRENMSDDDFIKANPLSKIWPAAEVDKIEDKATAALAYLFRAEIPAKPRVSYKLDRWVRKVKEARASMDLIAENRDEFVRIARAGDLLNPFMAKYDLLVSIDRDNWNRIGNVRDFSRAYVYGENGERVAKPSIMVEVDGRRINKEGALTIEDMMPMVNEALEAKQAAPEKTMQFEIRTNTYTGVTFINKKGDKDRSRLKEFTGETKLRDAREYLVNNQAELIAEWEKVKDRKNVKKSDIRSDENAARTGKDYRNGKDITPEQFMSAFGFRGVEFGNWVKQGKGGKERQGLLNDAYDAFMDLSEVVGVPPKAISLNGSLGIGMGSRGRGSMYAAHFEPDSIVINLTKTKGAGALAHEWFHALDNYFSRMRDGTVQESRKGKLAQRDAKFSYITFQPEPQLVNKKRPEYKIPEKELESRIERYGNQGMYSREEWEIDSKHPAGVRPEVEKAFAELVRTLNESEMKARALTVDGGKPGYWSEIIERAARSFENYVITKLKDSGGKNDFLANVTPIENWPREANRYPYLLDDEITDVANAFDNLFNTIETKETEDGNVAMFSMKEDSGTIDAQPQEQSNDPDIQTLKSAINEFRSETGNSYKESDIGLPDDLRAALETAFGREIKGFTTESGFDFNGVVLPQNESVIYVNANADKPLMAVAGHEFMHGLKQDNPELYAQGLDAMAKAGGFFGYNAYKKKMDAATDKEGVRRMRADQIQEEMMADILGDNFVRPEFWAKVSQHLDDTKPGAFNQLMQAVKKFLAKLKEMLSPLGSNSFVKDVEAAQNVVAEMTALHMKSRMGNAKAKTEIQRLRQEMDGVNMSRQLNNEDSLSFKKARFRGGDVEIASIDGVDFVLSDEGSDVGFKLTVPYTLQWSKFDMNGSLLKTGSDWITRPDPSKLADFENVAPKIAKILKGNDSKFIGTFIRFNNLPKGGRSRNHATGVLEKGVSVFGSRLNRLKGVFELDESDSIVSSAHMSYVVSGAPVYLVKGDVVGRGSDGEPVISNAKVISELKYDVDNEGYKIPDSGTDQAGNANIMFSRKYPVADKSTKPTDKETDVILGEWKAINERKKQGYDRFERVNQLQKILDTKSETKAPDLYGAIQRYLAILPVKVQDFGRESEAIILDMSKNNVTDDVMGLYLYAKHAPERNAYLSETMDVENGSGMATEDAMRLQESLREQYPTIEAHAAKWRELIDKQLDERVNAGTVSAESRDLWREIYPNYVPLKNAVDMRTELNDGDGEISVTPLDGFAGTGQRFNLTGAEIKRAKGRVSMAGNILANAVFDMQRGIVRGEKNRVNRLLDYAIKAYPQKSLWEINSEDKTDPQKEIGYFVDGEKRNALIKDRELLSALKGLDEDPLALVDKMIIFIKRTITAWNPAFTVINSARDSQMAIVNGAQELGAEGAATMTKYVKNAMTASWRYEQNKQAQDAVGAEWDYWHKLYRDAGGKTGFMDMKNLAETQKQIQNLFLKNEKLTVRNMLPKTGKAIYENVFKYIEDMGSATENMWRLASFRTAVEQGMNPDEAAKIAKNLTVNFDRKGTMARKLDRFFLFYNPAMQGLARMAQTLNSPKRVLAVAGSLVAMGFAAGMQGEEDEFGNNIFDLLPEHEKMRSIPIIMDGGLRLNIPMSYGLGFFTHTGMKMAQALRYARTNGRNGVSAEKMFKDMINGAALHFNPIGGMQFTEAASGKESEFLQLLSPYLLDPFIQINTNTNFFGGSLYPENPFNKNDVPDSEKVFEFQKGTLFDHVAKGMSRATGGDGVKDGLVEFTPATIETVWRTLTGGAGRFFEQSVMLPFHMIGENDFEPRQVPVVSTVLKKGEDKLYYNAYREITDDVKQFESRFKDYAESRDPEVRARVNDLLTDPKREMIAPVKAIDKAVRDVRKQLKEAKVRLDMADAQRKPLIKERIKMLEKRETELRAKLVQLNGEQRARQ